MIHALAIGNYRSLLKLIVPLGQLNLISGANASGKSNLYRALRLLSEMAQGGVVHSIANEGGLDSTFWAGPENISNKMHIGEVAVQGGPKHKSVRLRLGFCSDTFAYAISLGLPVPGNLGPSAFSLDPEIKRECIKLYQHGLLRPLTASELSDGTLRYLLWVAALLTPRPPSLMVLNEPETSLHPDLLSALARLIAKAVNSTQIWVVTHSSRLINELERSDQCHSLRLEKNLGQSQLSGQGILDQPAWMWPDNSR